MDYIANVENSEIDVSGIRTVLVQGDSSYPVIRFVLDPSLTGLSWRVRGTYTATNIAVLSPEILATESATEITLDWSVGSDFTTYDGDMQLSLVGSNGTGTTVVKALADITIQKDWSIGTMGSITLNLFEQLMAQADAAISKYPTIIGGNWYAWNVTVGEYQDTGVAASSQWKSGTGITGTSTTPTAFPSSGITMSNVGDMYLNATTGNTYRCTSSGAAAVALWVYVSNITGPQGIPGTNGTNGTNGVGVPVGGSIRQALVKSSATDYDTGWASNLLQYSTMPTAATGNLGQVAQFTGTTGTYTHGHIYECVSSGGGSPTYSWSEIVYGDPNSVSYSAQTGKTDAEKAQALLNIGGMPSGAISSNLAINSNFIINQLAKSGTVTLAAGAYGHDMWKAGASGCTYTFSTSENITTLTISAGSLIQVIEGVNLQSGTVCLSWAGTAQGKIGAGSYSSSGVTGTATGGTNLNIEFNTGTLSKVQLNYGLVPLPFVLEDYAEELKSCKVYFKRILTTILRMTYYQANFLAFDMTKISEGMRLSSPTIVLTTFTVDTIAGGSSGGGFTLGSTTARDIQMNKTSHGLTDGLLVITDGYADARM